MLYAGETAKNTVEVTYTTRCVNIETGEVVSQGGPVGASLEQIKAFMTEAAPFDAERGHRREVIKITVVRTESLGED